MFRLFPALMIVVSPLALAACVSTSPPAETRVIVQPAPAQPAPPPVVVTPAPQ